MSSSKRYIVPKYLGCERCGLHRFRKNIVFGRGDLPADILFVGEGPGVSEDLKGIPFIGPSGVLLTRGIEIACSLINVPAPPRYFITNVVACRPCDSRTGDNRQPTDKESWACWERLQQTYLDTRARKVVFLGDVPRKMYQRTWPDAVTLSHPAYILRIGGTESPSFIAFCRDLSAVFQEVLNAREASKRNSLPR